MLCRHTIDALPYTIPCSRSGKYLASADDQGSINLTWDYFNVCLWSTLEITIGIICTCMPTLRLILVRITRQVSSTFKDSSYYASRRKSDATKETSTEMSATVVSSKRDIEDGLDCSSEKNLTTR